MTAFEILNFYTTTLGVTPEHVRKYAPPTHPDQFRVFVAESMMDAIDAVPGIARAFLRNERLVLITLDKDLRRFGESEFDLLALMHPITTYNTLVSHPEQLEIKTTSAVTLSLGSRKPSHLQIPQNILRTDITSPKLWKRFSDLQHGTRAVAYNWPINTELT